MEFVGWVENGAAVSLMAMARAAFFIIFCVLKVACGSDSRAYYP